MATTNPTLSGPDWQLIVATGDEFLLSLPQASPNISIAAGSGTDEPPAAGIFGHSLCPGRDGMTRALIGPGPVFARCVDSSASVTMALTVWTPA